ncbi:MAG: hypothetical protein IKY75_03895 [Bacteroidaceae bacterium]|nr:hypothetical protein [Bacteroidaceae bacterium]
MLQRLFKLSFCVVGVLMSLVSCSTAKLSTTKVAYQSIRTTEFHETIPEDAVISVGYGFTPKGEIVVAVRNNTDEVMIIDQTKSFLVDTDGKSYSYYDPTVRTTTTTDISSSTSGASVNLGSVARAFGVGGILGGALSGVNVGGSDTYGQSISNTTYIADLPQVTLGPKGVGVMSKNFSVSNVGTYHLKNAVQSFNVDNPKESPYRFSVCVTYSVDNGVTYDKIVTDFFVNSQIVENVNEHGRVNKALQQLYLDKPEALYEPCYILYFVNNIPSQAGVKDVKQEGSLKDYK